MAFLEDKGVAAGTDASTVDLFNVSALELHGPRDPFRKLKASGSVYALALLEGKGGAAGTSASTADLFNISALKLHGPRDPFQKLQASGFAHAWQSWTVRA